ncbi:MAG: hypothetical protein R3F60_26230 [bacterium]
MPQFTEFPPLPPGEPSKALTVLMDVLKAIPAEGEAFRELRKRLKGAELWSRERLPQLLRFFRLTQDDVVRPSPLVLALAGGEAAAHKAIADRLWEVNPLLFTTVYQRLEERVHSVSELLKYLDSFAYAGTRLSGPEVRGWLRLGQAVGLFRLVGIALALTDEARARFGPRILGFDVEEFLEEDQDEPELVGAAAADEPPAAAPVEVAPPRAPTPAPAPMAPPPTVVLPVGVSPSGAAAPSRWRRFASARPSARPSGPSPWSASSAGGAKRPWTIPGRRPPTSASTPRPSRRIPSRASSGWPWRRPSPSAPTPTARSRGSRPCATRGRWTPCTPAPAPTAPSRWTRTPSSRPPW